MSTPAPLSKWLVQGFALAALIVTLDPTPGVDAQAPVTQTLARYNLERYFADSLSTGAQRMITRGGSTSQITAASTIGRDVFLPTRVAAVALLEPVTPGGDTRVVLPDRAFVETSGGVGMLLVPVVIIEGGGLHYQNGVFRGSIRVGVEDSLRTAGSADLPSPVRFFVSGTADSILLPDTAVAHTNLPFPAISLVEATRGPTVSLNVRTSLHRDGVDVDVPVVLDTLPLAATPRSIQGMGLEEARLVLGPATVGAGTVVQLAADNGNLSDSEVRLSPDGTATATLRSSWFGPSTVTARGIPFADARISVDFAFPWIFLAVALVGGVLGGLGAWLQKKGDAARRVAQGAVLGLIAAVLYTVGVNVTPIQPGVTTGQAVVFGLAAVAGYLGTLRVPGATGGGG